VYDKSGRWYECNSPLPIPPSPLILLHVTGYLTTSGVSICFPSPILVKLGTADYPVGTAY